ncbi:MAG: hypothetical protein HIU84_14925 [Acidobacteria bacterium]|nr:hypothetical protein [Acidobacteriota bacterium]
MEAPALLAARFSDELIRELQALLNTSLGPEGETVLTISVLTAPATPGWRDRVLPSLNFDNPHVAGN